MIYIYCAIILLNSLAGIYGAIKMKQIDNSCYRPMIGFSNSLIASIGFNHMFPHASEIFYGNMACNICFMFLFILEKFFLHIHNHVSHHSSMILNVLGISIHACLAGISLGTSEDSSSMLNIFIAIISHKIFATFSLATKYKDTLWILLCFSFVTPLCAILANVLKLHDLTSDSIYILEGVSAGTFLYLGLNELFIETGESENIHGLYTSDNAKKQKVLTLVSIILGTIVGILVSSPLVVGNHEHDHQVHYNSTHIEFLDNQYDHDDHDDHDH